MDAALRELVVLAVDCQASGATPAHGDLLEMGWSMCTADRAPGPVQSRWIRPRSERRVPRAVRELTGWQESCLGDSVGEEEAWAELHTALASLPSRAPFATVIHYARFELTFLRDLHQRLSPSQSEPFPFDAVCLHAIAARLFPDLPRRNIRALAGFLGHSPELMRRSAGHVEATVFIWRALVPLLEQAGLTTWTQLKSWLEQPASRPRRTKREFPLSLERRRALPDRPGVYRFLRRNGDVLYVGKATSLKARVAGHFKRTGPSSERVLELLSQVNDIEPTETASLLEAALLETDEIKRIDPPYNVQLRSGDRRAWFAARNLSEAVPLPDADHPIGPLPSQRALAPLYALIALASGMEPSPHLRAMALSVPSADLPDDALFLAGWQAFMADHLQSAQGSPARRIDAASRALWIARGRSEPDAPDESAPEPWDLARVRRRLERGLVQSGLLVRRARMLCLLADATLAFRELDMASPRSLVIAGGEILERTDLTHVTDIFEWPTRFPASRAARKAIFDAGTYDRLRVLLTELRRIQLEGGDVALRVANHSFDPPKLSTLMRPL